MTSAESGLVASVGSVHPVGSVSSIGPVASFCYSSQTKCAFFKHISEQRNVCAHTVKLLIVAANGKKNKTSSHGNHMTHSGPLPMRNACTHVILLSLEMSALKLLSHWLLFLSTKKTETGFVGNDPNIKFEQSHGPFCSSSQTDCLLSNPTPLCFSPNGNARFQIQRNVLSHPPHPHS